MCGMVGDEGVGKSMYWIAGMWISLMYRVLQFCSVVQNSILHLTIHKFLKKNLFIVFVFRVFPTFTKDKKLCGE